MNDMQMNALGWIKISDTMPDDGQEVTILMMHGQIRQVVCDSNYSCGFKQANCAGWECLSLAKLEYTVTHWRPEIHKRQKGSGPEDAPWNAE